MAAKKRWNVCGVVRQSRHCCVWGGRIVATVAGSPKCGGTNLGLQFNIGIPMLCIGSVKSQKTVGYDESGWGCLKSRAAACWNRFGSGSWFRGNASGKKSLTEVQPLAALGYHDNIVGYNTNWFENEQLCIQMGPSSHLWTEGLCDESRCLRSDLSCAHSGRAVSSRELKKKLRQMATNFNRVLDDVSITGLTFGWEFIAAIEGKQVVAQEDRPTSV
ncbi:Protein kinase, ATP binding site-containing protein [Artemisia annua]|uniref:Prohibitin n=1 Tax=Artemisia annua TaxID=35608 RepID=A0A2U1N087_ARTAN|nr:Protein kinase, ATP binding site-containing protein [Artemisia annua]